MGGNRNGNNFTVQARYDGRREFYQHDDREEVVNRNVTQRQKYNSDRARNYQNWTRRGNRRGGQGNYQGGGGGSRNYLNDEDVQMDVRNRHQHFYEQSRRGRKYAGRKPTSRPILPTSGWHKITIKDVYQYSKESIMSSLERSIDDVFVPILVSFEAQNLTFFLEKNIPVVKAIVILNGRFSVEDDNHYVSISCTDAVPPVKKFTDQEEEKIKAVMSARYSVELNRLDLKNFYTDPMLVKEGIFCPLNRRTMFTVMKILSVNCAQVVEIDLSQNQLGHVQDLGVLTTCVNLKRLFLEKNKIKHMDALVKLKNLPITELTLDGNPVCDKFKDIESYTSAVRELFPKIERLDGMDLPKPIGFEVEDEAILPPTQPSFFCSDAVKGIVIQFIEQYYQVFESGDRKQLEAAYTEDATFSVSANLPENGAGARFSGWVTKENRNLKKITNTEKRVSLLYKGRAAICDLLCRFPKTLLHDPNSFVIDIPLAQPTLMHAVLTGVFKQEVDRVPPMRNFMRSLIIVPLGSGFCISNEELYINNATVEQVRKAFKEPAPPTVAAVPPQVASPSAPVASPQVNSLHSPAGVTATAGLQPVQLELISQFALHSKMLPEYCKMCLERNDWNFDKAGEMFVNLQKENKIPPEYFGPQS